MVRGEWKQLSVSEHYVLQDDINARTQEIEKDSP